MRGRRRRELGCMRRHVSSLNASRQCSRRSQSACRCLSRCPCPCPFPFLCKRSCPFAQRLARGKSRRRNLRDRSSRRSRRNLLPKQLRRLPKQPRLRWPHRLVHRPLDRVLFRPSRPRDRTDQWWGLRRARSLRPQRKRDRLPAMPCHRRGKLPSGCFPSRPRHGARRVAQHHHLWKRCTRRLSSTWHGRRITSLGGRQTRQRTGSRMPHATSRPRSRASPRRPGSECRTRSLD